MAHLPPTIIQYWGGKDGVHPWGWLFSQLNLCGRFRPLEDLVFSIFFLWHFWGMPPEVVFWLPHSPTPTQTPTLIAVAECILSSKYPEQPTKTKLLFSFYKQES